MLYTPSLRLSLYPSSHSNGNYANPTPEQAMEFPFGHGHHHHHHRDEEENRPPYPPPGQYPDPYAPPPPHRPGDWPEEGSFGRPAYPPPPPAVHHVSHEVAFEPPRPFPGPGFEEGSYGSHGHHHGHAPPPPYSSGVHHEGYGGGPAVERKPTVRVFTKAGENYSLSIRDRKVVLVRSDPDDEYQHWIKDQKYSTTVKDEEGAPSFALINKATGEAIKHSIGKEHPVRLIRYNPDYLDESVLWTESKDLGDGFRCIRMVNNIRLVFDAFHGDKDHGGVRDGTVVMLWDCWKGDNQRR